MSPRRLRHELVREVSLLGTDEPLRTAVHKVIEAELPALPVCGANGKLVGIFGEREFIAAALPGYVGQLPYAAFVPRAIDAALEQRAECGQEPVSKHMNTEHIDVGPDFSDAQLAETFLHHRVLIVPVVDAGRVTGVVTRADFFKTLAERVLPDPA